MLRKGKDYIIGVSVSKNHLTVNLFSKKVLTNFSPRLHKYEPKKFTFIVPLNWKVDDALLQSLAKARIAEIKKA